MNTEELKQKLTDEGFVHVFDWTDAPGTEYAAHSHKGQVSMYIMSGGLTFHFGDEVVALVAGERFDVPVGKEHVATVGPEGCTYIVGEMIEGDS
jgi:quercetin dioxygenase-like cupin family protein